MDFLSVCDTEKSFKREKSDEKALICLKQMIRKRANIGGQSCVNPHATGFCCCHFP
jgi:hypothetical protein